MAARKTTLPTLAAPPWLVSSLLPILLLALTPACATVADGTVQSLGQGTVFVRSDSLEPGDTVLVRHYAHCRSISPCRWLVTRGIVEGALASEPRLVTVTVPVVVHAELSDYADVGDEVRKASK